MMYNGFDLGMIVDKNINSEILKRLYPVESVLSKIYGTSRNYPDKVMNLRLVSYENKRLLVMKFIWESDRRMPSSIMAHTLYDKGDGYFGISIGEQPEKAVKRCTSDEFIAYIESRFLKGKAPDRYMP